MIHRSVIGRRDLLLCAGRFPDAPLDLLARLCGYEVREGDTVRFQQREFEKSDGIVSTVPKAKVPKIDVVPARTQFLVPTFACFIGDARKLEASRKAAYYDRLEPLSPDELSARDKPLPRTAPLQPWSRLWPFFHERLGSHYESAAIDHMRLVRDLASLRPIDRVPRQQFVAWSDRVRILFDRRLALLPFWEDVEALLSRLRQMHGEEGFCVDYLNGLPPAELPASGEMILAISDMGCLSGDTRLITKWSDYGRKLSRRGAKGTALMPCPRNRWDRSLTSAWACACWDRGELLPRGRQGLQPRYEADEAEARAVRLDELLTAIAPLLRVEPGLLRSVRLLLGGGRADVGTEFDAWHSPLVAHDYTAMALRADVVVEKRKNFRKLDARVKDLVAHKAGVWHDRCSAPFRARETDYLANCGAALPPGAKEKAGETLDRGIKSMLDLARRDKMEEAKRLGYTIMQQRDLARSSVEDRQRDETIGASWAIMRRWKKEDSSEVPSGIDPASVAWVDDALESGAADETLFGLWQAGKNLVFRPWDITRLNQPEPGSLAHGSPLALIPARKLEFDLGVEDEVGQRSFYKMMVEERKEAAFDVAGARALLVATDCAELEFELMPKPQWAKRMGRDRFGLFAEFEVKGVMFKLRWMPPGTFTMGSPNDEAGRFDWEGPQHQVTISQGYWLAETPCTQAQWQAVRGKNPSHFKGDKRPVECVSWDDCREFCAMLGKQIPELEFRLPTEAEWEYACRAGTASAFNDGSACTNPEGKDKALEKLGWHGEGGKGETHPVRERLPNAWGLHDMHGNVDEWCSDWYGEYAAESQTDPVGPEKGANRVIRSGSCWDDAWNCRSACRYGGGPVNRYSSHGFRLAAGYKYQSGATGLAAGGAGRAGLRDEAPAARQVRVARRWGKDPKPAWATIWEEDKFGRLAGFELNRVAWLFRWIAPGEFLMGSPDDEVGRYGDEGPQHQVSLTRGFWLGVTPCTQAQWEIVTGKNPSHFKGATHPVEQVSWNDCVEFCQFISKRVEGLKFRLPTEAEWEYACRAGTMSAFNDGSSCTEPSGVVPALERLGWYDKNSGKQTHPVGEKQPNAWGLQDMHGNVWEWCSDGKRSYVGEAQVDPVGPEKGAVRVIRGGSYWNSAGDCRSACRFRYGPDVRFSFLGFRLAAG